MRSWPGCPPRQTDRDQRSRQGDRDGNAMTDKIKVFLVDDQELVRAGFAMVIGSQDDLEVVGQAGDGGEAVERLAVTAADVVIMDVRMPRMDGVQATKIITERL